MRKRIGIATGLLLLLSLVAAWLLSSAGGAEEPIVAKDPCSSFVGHAATRPGHSGVPMASIESERFVEAAEVVDGIAEAEHRLEIEVVGPRGNAAEGAEVFLHREEVVLERGTTDARGVVVFPAGLGDAQVVVVPDGSPAHRASVSLLAGRRRILLPAGVSIAGRVEVNDGAPGRPVALRLASEEERLPAFVRAALTGDGSVTCMTTASGLFDFGGVREGSEWRIEGILGHRVDKVFSDGREVFVITAPAGRVVVKLATVPVISGRLVSEGAGAPVPRAPATVFLNGPRCSSQRALQTDDQGRFAFSLEGRCPPSELFTRVEVTFRWPTGVGERRLALDPAPTQDLDLGDVEIAAGKVIRFALSDPSGHPIEGGFARVGLGNDPDRGSRTDARGIGSIAVGPGTSDLQVGALKFEVADVPIPAVAPDLLPVTLTPGSGLDISVRAHAGVPLSTFKVRLTATSHKVFNRDVGRNHSIHVTAGASQSGLPYWGSEGPVIDFVPDSTGRVVIAGLNPGVRLTVAAIDTLGEAHDSTDLTLGAGEWKTVVLSVKKVPESFRGRVRDATGHPVAGARVVVEPGQAIGVSLPSGQVLGTEITVSTDAAGRFEVLFFFASTVNVVATKPGFVPAVRRGVEVTGGDGDLELILEKACRLTVRVFEADGDPISNLSIEGRIKGYQPMGGAPKEPGVYVFSDLPVDRTITIYSEWAHRLWSREIVVKGDQVEQITMPTTGGITVDVSALGAPPFTLVIRPVDEGGRVIRQWVPVLGPGNPVPREITVSPLVTGDYDATIEREGSDRPVILGATQRVTVRPMETTRIVFEKP